MLLRICSLLQHSHGDGVYLAELGPWRVLPGGSGHLEAQPVVKAQGVQLLGVQHPPAALGHAQEPLLVVDVNRVLVDLVPQLCIKIVNSFNTSADFEASQGGVGPLLAPE